MCVDSCITTIAVHITAIYFWFHSLLLFIWAQYHVYGVIVSKTNVFVAFSFFSFFFTGERHSALNIYPTSPGVFFRRCKMYTRFQVCRCLAEEALKKKTRKRNKERVHAPQACYGRGACSAPWWQQGAERKLGTRCLADHGLMTRELHLPCGVSSSAPRPQLPLLLERVPFPISVAVFFPSMPALPDRS